MLAALAGCGGGDGATAAQWVPAPPSAVPPSPTAPARVAKLTSACKLLSAEAVMKVLGPTSKTKLKARELPVDKSDGSVAYACSYGKDGQEPFALNVSTRPDRADGAQEAIDAIADAYDGSTPVEGVGAAGVGYVTDGGFRLVAIAVPYETDLRLVVFGGPKLVPQAKLVEVAEQVVAKI
ncbi:hypothetical protein Asi02nite_51030 [Asanoa siamensis]|uniref:DUF3558 domain-containing protein n=1 Tax=Asanoa siamensis TaxID=926357 RepID=A0ABQ4CWD2_9ACTN|nr:hypothetical protein Asi02nite_51030 [Asanoa siamensis]